MCCIGCQNTSLFRSGYLVCRRNVEELFNDFSVIIIIIIIIITKQNSKNKTNVVLPHIRLSIRSSIGPTVVSSLQLSFPPFLLTLRPPNSRHSVVLPFLMLLQSLCTIYFRVFVVFGRWSDAQNNGVR